jgi:asparagine synthase (glutamine-hydrolysing)
MFAFAIYDRVERTTFLARDRFGEKPLLIRESADGVAFASELAPLSALPQASREIDPQSLAGFLCLNYVPGSRTLMRGVSRLPAGEWRLYGERGLMRQGRYWSPPSGPAVTTATVGELLEQLQDRVDTAVRIALRSDVPVGLFLSGGVDSAVVAQSAARLGRLKRAYCVDVDGPHGFSEWTAASRVADRIGVDSVRVSLDASSLGEFLDVARHLDDPLADSSALAVWAVARAAASDLKVVLIGDGGDELFAGYLTYSLTRAHARLRPLLPGRAWQLMADTLRPAGLNGGEKLQFGQKLHRFLRAMPLPTREAHLTWNGTWLPEQAATLMNDGALRAAAQQALGDAAGATGDRPSLHDLQLADVRGYLANDILAKVDRMTMAHGIESRSPLLNSQLAEFALRLPEDARIRGGVTKFLLRELCARHFGHAHAYARKKGFSIPVHSWLREDGRPLLTGLLAHDRVKAAGVLDPAAVTAAVSQHLNGAPLGWEMWGLMILVAWIERHIHGAPDFRALPPVPEIDVPAATLS